VLTLEFLTSNTPATDVATIGRVATTLQDDVNAQSRLLAQIAAAHIAHADGSKVQRRVRTRRHADQQPRHQRRSASVASAKRMRAVLKEQSGVDSVALFGC
jgi:hypothetical protein